MIKGGFRNLSMMMQMNETETDDHTDPWVDPLDNDEYFGDILISPVHEYVDQIIYSDIDCQCYGDDDDCYCDGDTADTQHPLDVATLVGIRALSMLDCVDDHQFSETCAVVDDYKPMGEEAQYLAVLRGFETRSVRVRYGAVGAVEMESYDFIIDGKEVRIPCFFRDKHHYEGYFSIGMNILRMFSFSNLSCVPVKDVFIPKVYVGGGPLYGFWARDHDFKYHSFCHDYLERGFSAYLDYMREQVRRSIIIWTLNGEAPDIDYNPNGSSLRFRTDLLDFRIFGKYTNFMSNQMNGDPYVMAMFADHYKLGNAFLALPDS